jgi:hypothetical protein
MHWMAGFGLLVMPAMPLQTRGGVAKDNFGCWSNISWHATWSKSSPSDRRRDGRTRTRIPGMIRLTLAPIWTACAVRALVVHPAAAGSVLLLDQAAVGQGRLADLADAVVGRLAAVGTALGRPVVPVSGVPRLAHVAVPEVAGPGSAAVQPHRVGLCMAPPQHLNGIDCAPSAVRPSERPCPSSW